MATALAETHVDRRRNGAADELADEDLLEQFLNADDATSQEAFTALVERHGPMVLGICRHVLSQHHDAEDAFQATFLVLAKKGATIRNRRILAGWLHEVAHRIAIKARASAIRRRTIERQNIAMSPSRIELGNEENAAAWRELRPVLHAEVERLPEKYRIPVILSYLEGKTNEEVASLLHWPVGTVKGRLSRARELLRSRLMRRGLTLAAAFLMTALSRGTVFAEVVPADLVRRTVGLAAKFGPRSALLGSDGHETISLADQRVAISAESSIDPKRAALRFTRRNVGLLILALVTFSIATGIAIAMINARGVSPVQADFSVLGSSSKATAPSAPCRD